MMILQQTPVSHGSHSSSSLVGLSPCRSELNEGGGGPSLAASSLWLKPFKPVGLEKPACKEGNYHLGHLSF